MTTPSNEVLETKIQFMWELVEKIDKRFDKFETKFDKIIDEFNKKFSTKDDLKKVEIKADKNDAFIKKVMRTAVISLIGFLTQIVRTTLIK